MQYACNKTLDPQASSSSAPFSPNRTPEAESPKPPILTFSNPYLVEPNKRNVQDPYQTLRDDPL